MDLTHLASRRSMIIPTWQGMLEKDVAFGIKKLPKSTFVNFLFSK
jgi:hypothetical protein